MPEAHYSFDVNDALHVIILDACYDADDDEAGYDSGDFNYQNTYIPPAERTWLAADLAATALPTVVFVHQQLAELGSAEHRVDNREAVRAILEASGKVLAVFSGHSHTNATEVVNGIRYFAMQAATESAYPSNAYAVIKVFPSGRVVVEGGGGQTSYTG